MAQRMLAHKQSDMTCIDGTVNAGTQAIRWTCIQMVEWTYSQASSGAHTTRGLSSQTNKTHIISSITTFFHSHSLSHTVHCTGCSSIIHIKHIHLAASQHFFGWGGRCLNVILSASLAIKLQMAQQIINDKLERIWKGSQSTWGITKPGSWTDREETRTTSVTIARNTAKIWSGHLLNATSQCYDYNLLGKDFLNFDLGTL